MKKKFKIFTTIVCFMLVFMSINAYAIEKNVLVGNSRFETAVQVSEYGFEQANNIVLVNGESIADALSATPFAKLKNAPILLTEKNRLTDVTKSEIKRLKASNVYIIGGKGVVSDNVISELRKIGYSVYRIYGETRYETSLNVAKEIDKIKSISEIAVVNGYNGLADALSVASPAAIRNMPIILASTDELGSAEKWINSKAITKSYIIGGEGVISRYLESNLKNPQRIYGVDRWKTNARVLEHFFNQTDLYNIYLAKDGATKASELVDALAAGPVAAKQNSPVMLVGSNLDSWQEEYLKPRNTKAITQVGGGVNINTIEQVNKALNFKNVKETEVSYIDYLNCQQIEIYFGGAIDKNSVIQNGRLKKNAIEITARDNSVEGEVTGLDEFSARLEEDNKKLVITRDLNTGKIFNGTYTIRVTDIVKTEKGNSIDPYSIELQIRDTIKPQVRKIIYDDVYGNLSISFTKPIKNFPVITIDGKRVTEDNNIEFIDTRDTIILKREKLNELQAIGKTVQIIVSGGTDYRNLEMVRHASSLRLVKPGEERKVEDIKLKNAKEFTITFASPVDATSLVDANGKILKSNLQVTSEGTAHDNNSQIVNSDELYGVFSPDKRTVTIKREYNNDKNFNGSYRIVVTDSVKTTDGANFVKYDKTMELHDNLSPEVINTVYDTINGAIKITFSEPLKTKPTISIKGGLLANGQVKNFTVESEVQLDETDRSMITISYNAIKIHKLVNTDYPDGATYKLTINNATDFKDNKQIQDKYVDRNIHIKPIYEGFKVDKVEPASKDPKPGENEYLVYFNEKIFRPSVENFLIEGIAEKASDVVFITNPETNVSDSKVVKVIFGNGTVNKGNTVTGLENQTLVIRGVKAQSGAVLTENVAEVTVRDNTSPKLVEATLKDNQNDVNLVELKLRFNEPVKLDGLKDDYNKLKQTFDFTSQIQYIDINGKASMVTLDSDKLKNPKDSTIDSDSITYQFTKDVIDLSNSEEGVKNFNGLIAGKDFKVIAKNANTFEDMNGVDFKGNKDGNNELDKNIPTEVKVDRKNIYVGYISKYDKDSAVNGEIKYNIWFSERPSINQSSLEVEYTKSNTKKVVSADDIIVSQNPTNKDNNITTVSFKKNGINLDGIGGEINASMGIKEMYSYNGTGNKLNEKTISNIVLRDNMEAVLSRATFDDTTSSLKLEFDKEVKSKSVQKYFSNSMNIGSNGQYLTKYPEIKSVEPDNAEGKTIKINFNLDLSSTESKNKNRDEFLNFIMKNELMIKTIQSSSSNFIEDTRGWQIKSDENPYITFETNSLRYNVDNLNAKTDVNIDKIEYKYGSTEKKLIFTFTEEVNIDTVRDGWFNTIKINSGSDRLIYYPTASASKTQNKEITLEFNGGTDLNEFHQFMVSHSGITATTGYYPMKTNGSGIYNLMKDNSGVLVHSKKPGSTLSINVENLDETTGGTP